MCLITTSKLQIAKKDIIVYKVLLDNYYAPYQGFQYKLNILYKTKLKESDEWVCYDNIDQKYLDENFKDWREEIIENLICIGKGFHSALKKERLNKLLEEILAECTIPKGSKYYTEPTGLVVSNQIIINRILE